MGKYWSNSKLADWIRGVKKPECASGEEWEEWEEACKEKHPIRYWIAENWLDYIKDFIMWPIDKLYSIKYWFLNRFVTRTHQLTSNLPKGQWYEMDERILNCLFTELVNFVTEEKAWKQLVFNEEDPKKYDAPWNATGWFRLRNWKSEQAGMDYLNWETTLIKDEDWGYNKDDPEYGQPTEQAIVAQEIINLYKWWVETRPNRPDPYDVSGWTAICDRREKSGKWFVSSANETPEEAAEIKEALNLLHETEERYYEEDNQMLIRLIKIRRSLWT